jgi:hypothetical protein
MCSLCWLARERPSDPCAAGLKHRTEQFRKGEELRVTHLPGTVPADPGVMMFKMTSNSNGITSVIKNPALCRGKGSSQWQTRPGAGSQRPPGERRASTVTVSSRGVLARSSGRFGQPLCRLPEPVR